MPDPATLSDEELVHHIRNDDQELYRHIIERYEQKLRRYAMTFVRDEDVANDVLQNSFIKAFINLKGFNAKKKFSSWIYRIVHNEAINEIKRHKKELRLDDIPETKHMQSDEEGADEIADKKQARAMLKENLNELQLKYREPLVLFYLEEHSYQEIVEILHIPLGTVGTRIKRGLTILKSIFAKNHSRI